MHLKRNTCALSWKSFVSESQANDLVVDEDDPSLSARTLGISVASTIDQISEAIEKEIRNVNNFNSDVTVWQDRTFATNGIDSLRVMALQNSLQLALENQIELAPTAALLYPTIRLLASHIHQLLQSGSGPAKPEHLSRKILLAGALPLSLAQKRLAFLHDFDTDSHHYNEVVVLRFSGDVNLSSFTSIVNAIAMRQTSLRTIILTNSQTATVLSGTECYQLLKQGTVLASLLSPMLRSECSHHFTFSTKPVIRWRLIRTESDNLLSIVQHHIITDGFSIAILMNEMSALYEQFVAFKSLHLPPLAAHYFDYAAWEAQVAIKRFETQIPYWKEKLSDLDSQELPTDISRPMTQTFSGRLVHFTFNESFTQQIKDMAIQLNTTVYTVLLSLFNLLLYQNTGMSDLLVGIPMINRQTARYENIIGLFVNTLVIRTKLGDGKFGEVVDRVKQSLLDAHINQDLPFQLLLEKLAVERNPSISPLFQVMFVMDDKEILKKASKRTLTASPLEIDMDASKFDQTWYLAMTDKTLNLRIEYNTDLFYAKSITKTIQQYALLISQAHSCLFSTNFRYFHIVPEIDRRTVFEKNDRNRADFPRNHSIVQILNNQNDMSPSSVAVSYLFEKWNYLQLDNRTNQLARLIRQKQIQQCGSSVLPGQPIALFISRCFEMLVGILGALKSGFAFVPLNSQFPLERRQGVLEELGNPILLSSTEMDSTPGVLTIALNNNSILINYADKKLPLFTLASDLAYITYTSGTTGKPKGVCTSQQGIPNLIANYNRLFYLQTTSIIYQVVNYGFDISCADIFQTLFNGGNLVLAKDRIPSLNEVVRNQITHAYMMPAFLANLSENQLLELSNLELLAFGGETLQCNVLEFLVNSGFRAFQQIGVTEQTVFSAGQTMKLLDIPTSNGGPYVNHTIYILDENLNIVRPGRKSVTYYGGIGVSRGYYGNPELMKAKHISNPFKRNHVDSDNCKLFNSGDFFSQISFESPMIYNGRRDFQVKIRGIRVELGEIEQVIATYDTVKNCIVIPRKYPSSGTFLVAYVTPISGLLNSIDINTLLNNIRKQLPDYMVPRNVIVLETFPLNPNGKLDRGALPIPEDDIQPDWLTMPRNDLEQMIHHAWTEVLESSHFGVFECFFISGGNSLKATQVVNRINRTANSNLTVKAIFEHRTIEQLAKFLLQSDDSEGEYKTIEKMSANKLDPIVLSYTQKRLWFMYQFESANSHNYNISLSLRISEHINQRALHVSLNGISQKQSLLRTVIASNDSTNVYQTVLSGTESYLILRAGKWFNEAENVFKNYRYSFNLTQKPPIRTQSCVISNGLRVDFVMHHIITDGWSMALMAKELSLNYNLITSSAKIKMQKLDIHYADYSAWQNQYILESTSMQNQLKFWKRCLMGYDDLQLPTDMKRAGVKLTSGKTISFNLGTKRLLHELHKVVRDTESSLYIVLLTAFASLMHLLSKQETVLIGSPIANRNRVEVENLIGVFINTIVMKTKVKNAPFRALIGDVKEVALAAYRNQDIPFEYLVDELNVPRDLSRSPIFQVMFILQNASATALPKMNGIKTTVTDVFSDSAKFDWTWSLFEKEDCLRGTLEYNTSLFYSDTCFRAIQQFQIILESMSNDLNTTVSCNDFLPSAQKREILQKLCTRETPDVPRGRGIFDIISAQRKITPKSVVFRSLEEAITCDDLNNFANSVGALINQRFVQLTGCSMSADSSIAVFCQQSVELYASLITAQAIGGCYVPLDQGYPNERIAFTIEDSNARVVVCNIDFPDELKSNQFCVVDLRKRTEICTYYRKKILRLVSSEVNLAYIIYTSGTTGKPKGVCIKQKSLLTNIRFSTYNYYMSANCVVFTFAKCVFDACIPFIFGCLMNGAQYCVRDETLTAFSSLLSFAPINVLFLVPAISSSFTKREIQKLSEVAHMWSGGGSTIETKALDNILDSGIKYLQRYGPTEVTVYQTMTNMKQHSHFPAKIGSPVDNLFAYIVNQYDQLVSINKPGELLMAGKMVAAGYMKRPDLTKKAFIANPFNSRENSVLCLNTKLYRSGDCVALNPCGEVTYSGRLDTQVKLRGYRIELGEIENIISKHPDVRANVVTVSSGRDGSTSNDSIIVAYCIPSQTCVNGKLDTVGLRSYLKQKLPEYMVPHRIISMESFPTNFSGKIDRRALPKVDFSYSESGKSVRSPRTDGEKTIHQIWCDVLARDSIDIDDNFFDIGGHSLKATQVVARLRAIQINCELKAIFQNPTISLLAQFISGEALPSDETENISVISKSQPLSLSLMQNRLLFQSAYDKDASSTGSNIAYNISIALEMKGFCNFRAFQCAFNCLIQEQTSLRTVFCSIQPATQIILSGTETFVYLRPYCSKSFLSQLLEKDILFKFDVEYKAPIRIRMLLSRNVLVLSIAMHHIITDGWSNQILAEKLSNTYNKFVTRSTNSNLPQKPTIQYADYVPWDTAHVEKTKNELSKYWKAKLDGYEDLQLATDKLKPSSLSFWGSSVPFVFPNLNKSIEKVCQLFNVTPYMVMLAAFKLLMSRYSVGSQSDITVGSPIANRSHESIEKLIGFFTNTLVMRTNVGEEKSLPQILSDVKNTALQAFSHQDLPFEHLIELLNVKRSLSVSPVFQVMFVLQNTVQANLAASNGLTLTVIDVPICVTKFDLTLFVYQNGNHLTGYLEYLSSIFFHATVERIVRQYSVLLSNFCNSLCLISSTSTLPSSSALIPYQTSLQTKQNHYYSRLLPSDYPKETAVFTTFLRQVKITPKRILAELNDQVIDYITQSNRANMLAFHLNQKFVQCNGQSITADSVIAICSDRSFAMIDCILAVLKCGAAYLPLDSSHPADRIRFMISQTQASVCLGQLPENIGIATLDYIACNSISIRETKKHRSINMGNDLAYIIYTSGTTGRPKGTTVYQRSVLNMISQGCSIYFPNETDKTYQFTKYIFDNSVLEIFMAMFHGGRLVLFQGKVDQKTILTQIAQHSITHILLFPGIVNTFSKEELLQLSQLRYWIEGAEKANPEVMDYCLSNGITVVQNYGPTETTAYALWRRMRKLDNAANIGTQIGNSCGIISRHNGSIPVSFGIPGEFYILGEGVARGYFNQDNITRQKFIANANLTKEDEIRGKNGRLYDSGDIVKANPDESIVYVGRSDFQVKIRGFRVELTEIEQVLLLHENVEQCSVQSYSETENSPLSLVAYYVVRANAEITVDELREFLSHRLTDYMVPSFFIQMETIPLTPNSKIDRVKLPKPEKQQNSSESLVILPQNAVEWIIHNAWTEALELKSVSVRENFFEIGGHSLIAGKVCSRISDSLGKECKIKWLFENPTIESLVKFLQNSALSVKKPKFVQIDKNLPLQLSFGQEQMWFLHQHSEDASFLYNLPFIQEFDDRLNVRAVHVSLMSFMQRQTSFRTIFVQKELSEPQQVILSSTESYIAPYQILIKEFELSTLLRGNYSIRLDIDKKPAIQNFFYHTTDNRLVLEMLLHHIISDAWSTQLMSREMGEYYASFIEQKQLSLEPLSYQYVDFAAWQREHLKGETLNAMVSFWKDKLSGYTETPLNLETDAPRPAVPSRKCGKIEFIFEKSLQDLLIEYCKRTGSTTYITVLTAFGLLLHKLSNRNRILIGSPTANRTQRETENIYGYFLNNLVMNLEFNSAAKVAEYAGAVKRTVLDAYEHQELPFELLVSSLNLSRELNNQPLFQVYFNCRYDLEDEGNVGIMHAKITEISARDIGIFDIDFDIDEGYKGLTGSFAYNSDIFHHQRMLKAVHQFQYILRQIISVHQCEISLTQVACMPAQQNKIIRQFNRTEDFPTYRTMSSIFFAQQQRTPKHIQIRHLDRRLTYEEVEMQTSKGSKCLQQKFIAISGETLKPDSIVALYLERQINTPLIMLTSLKSGCAYLPISTEYPRVRQKFLVENSKSALIITNGDGLEGLESEYNAAIVNMEHDELFSHYRIKNRWEIGTKIDIACAMYTSGTTGNPKGVALRQEQLTSFLNCSTKRSLKYDGGVVFNFCAYVFDNIVDEYFGTFMNGATSLIPTTNLETVETLLKEPLMNCVFMPPTFSQTIDERTGRLLSERAELFDFGGEAFNNSIFERVLNWGTKIMLTYGPTETAVDNTFRMMKLLDNCMNNGQPMTNSHIYLIDSMGDFVPVGSAGEVVISGPTARGYLNVSPEIAARFYPNPYQTAEQAIKGIYCKAYKCGDYAKWLSNGQMIFIGRIDCQLKIRGMRVELEDVESVMLKFPGIEGAAVTVLNDSQGRAQGLVGYYVTVQENIRKDFIDFLKQSLPPHMVPSFYIKIDRILTTINGKVDRRALSAYFEEKRSEYGQESSAIEEEVSEFEKSVMSVWSECLGHSTIRANDNFFDVGGNSLLTVKLRSLLELRINAKVRIADIFKYQTVRSLADFIQSQQNSEESSESKADVIVSIGKKTNFPLDVFFLHPLVGGAVFPYQHLVSRIKARTNFLGIQHPNTFDLLPALQANSLRELVSFYLKEINAANAVKYEGSGRGKPTEFVMIGSSLGGILAQEAASQLEHQDRAPPFIICIDSVMSDDPTWSRTDHVNQMKSIFVQYDMRMSETLQETMIENAWQLLKMCSNHAVAPMTNTQMYLFRIEKDNGMGRDYGWGRDCTKQVIIDDIPGEHFNMLFPEKCMKISLKIAAILKEYDSLV